jgi:integrase
MARKSLSDRQIAKLERRPNRYSLPDPSQPGLVLRVPKEGPVSFCAVARKPKGAQLWHTVGTTATIGIDEARALAREVVRRIKAGLSPAEPLPPPVLSVANIAEQWLVKHVEENGHRTARERARIVSYYVVPRIGSRVLSELRKVDVAGLLDDIAKQHGKAQADAVLRVLSSMSTWWQSRTDDFTPINFRGMRRATGHRTRILTDDELRAVWAESAGWGSLGVLIRLALMTCQRREAILSARWSDISDDGIWTVRQADRQKGTGGALQLPQPALDALARQPRMHGNPLVFPTRPHSRTLEKFRQATGTRGWVVHDLRRTARSLLSRSGTQTEISERILGHAQRGIVAVYDHFDYFEPKNAALGQLSALIERIVSPPSANVVALSAAS